MPISRTRKKPWKRYLAGVAELADWAGVKAPAIASVIERDEQFPEPLDYIRAATVYEFSKARRRLEELGFREGGGPREGYVGGVRSNSEN